MNVINCIEELSKVISNLGDSLEDEFQKVKYTYTLNNLLMEFHQTYWITKDGTILPISDMGTTHIVHVLLTWAGSEIEKDSLRVSLECISHELLKRAGTSIPIYKDNCWSFKSLDNCMEILDIKYPRSTSERVARWATLYGYCRKQYEGYKMFHISDY